MRTGDWFVVAAMLLNCGALVAYAAQGVWPNALYFLCAFGINGAVLWGMR